MIEASTIRSATWRELEQQTQGDYVIWTAHEVPGIARIAHSGALFWRFRGGDYHNIEALTEAYNTYLQQREQPVVIPEAAVRLALAAQLGVAPEAIPDDTRMLAGMRRALAAYVTSCRSA